MSTVSRAQLSSRSEAVAAVTVVWRIDRAALAVARPDLARTPQTPGRREALLRVTIARDRLGAALDDPARQSVTPLELGPARITSDEHNCFIHLTAEGDEGLLLTVSLRRGSGGLSLVYARTTLLARLGVPGARYTRPELGD